MDFPNFTVDGQQFRLSETSDGDYILSHVIDGKPACKVAYLPLGCGFDDEFVKERAMMHLAECMVVVESSD